MAEFSNRLEQYIEEKHIKVSELARFCGTDRATTYKYINGKRLPAAMETVEKIGEFLRLSPREVKQLKEAYEMDRVGKSVYLSRKNVEEFFLHFPEMPPDEEQKHFMEEFTEKMDGEAGSHVIKDKKDLNRAICRMLLKEGEREDSRIYLQLQPADTFLFEFLAARADSFGRSRIEHIMCMNHDTQDAKKAADNLNNLNQIILLHASMLNYQSYYFYDNVDSHYHNLNLLPCMVLTSTQVLFFQPDDEMGILTDKPEAVEMMRRRFEKNRDACNPFLHAITNGFLEYETLSKIIYQIDCHSIQADPCVMPYLSPDMVKNYISDPVLRQGLEGVLISYGEAWSLKSRKDARVYMTTAGLKYFMDTGLNLEIPVFTGVLFTKEDRLMILRKTVREPRCYNYILKEPLGSLPLNMHWYVTKEAGVLLFYNKKKEQVYLILREPSLLHMFADYMESMDETHYYSLEESQKILEDVLKQYEEAWA